MKFWICILSLSVCASVVAAKKKKADALPPSPLDRYVAESAARSAAAPAATPGAIWLAGSRLADSARDVRASQVDDVLTIVVAEQASAVTTGATKTQRSSSNKTSISW
jgi:flagellar basal body L-ring protein FlgH